MLDILRLRLFHHAQMTHSRPSNPPVKPRLEGNELGVSGDRVVDVEGYAHARRLTLHRLLLRLCSIEADRPDSMQRNRRYRGARRL